MFHFFRHFLWAIHTHKLFDTHTCFLVRSFIIGRFVNFRRHSRNKKNADKTTAKKWTGGLNWALWCCCFVKTCAFSFWHMFFIASHSVQQLGKEYICLTRTYTFHLFTNYAFQELFNFRIKRAHKNVVIVYFMLCRGDRRSNKTYFNNIALVFFLILVKFCKAFPFPGRTYILHFCIPWIMAFQPNRTWITIITFHLQNLLLQFMKRQKQNHLYFTALLIRLKLLSSLFFAPNKFNMTSKICFNSMPCALFPPPFLSFQSLSLSFSLTNWII